MRCFRVLIVSLALYLIFYNYAYITLYVLFITLLFKHKRELIIGTIIGLFMIMNAVLAYQRVLPSGEYIFTAKVKSVSINNVVVKYKGYNIAVYTDKLIEPGDVLYIKGNLTIPEDRDNEAGFNYKKYLLSKNITNTIHNPEVKKIRSEFSIERYMYKIKQSLRVDKEYQVYIDALVFGEKLTGDVQGSIQNLGVSHLFAISGLHINLIASTMSMLLLKLTGKKQDKVICWFLGFYMVLTSFAVSVVRASLLFIIPRVYKNDDMDSLPILSIITIVFIFWNPFIIFNNGFVFSFLVSFVLILTSLITGHLKGIESTLATILVVFIFTIPITAYYSFEINLFSIVHNFILGFVVILVILPLAFLTVLIPFVSMIVYPVFDMFNLLVKWMNILNLNIIVGRPLVFYIIGYYFLLIYVIMQIELGKYKNRDLFCFLFMLSMIYLPNKLVVKSTVTFLNVGNADSIVINSPKNNCNAVIDIGETTYSDNLNKKIVPYIKRKGISRIDKLFLTHDHYDHHGKYKELISLLNVKDLIGNKYTKLLVNQRVGYGENVKCGSLTFKVLNPSVNLDFNNNSLVLYLLMDNIGYLFMADVEVVVENALVNVIKELKVDVLKIGHHGSNTSTSNYFISNVKPKVAVISVGKSNYNHPSVSTLDILNRNRIRYYMTINEGYLVFREYRGRAIIER